MDLSALPVLVVIVAVNYLAGIWIAHEKKKNRERAAAVLLFFAIVFNVGLLVYFKYAKFVLGISFMSLSAISYQADIYRKKIQAAVNPLAFALYLSFFGKIIEGPVVRYADIHTQLSCPDFTSERFVEGIRRFAEGLAKKVLLADRVGVIAHEILGLDNLSPDLAWLGLISFTLQIYLDFAGYSDMAIGLGKMFGLDFKENFDNPYMSVSLTEFWHRWHISLSRWLRDYVYIPLGGSRIGIIYINLLLTFLIAGFWHGVTWNYILWGAWNGLILCFERFWNQKIGVRSPKFIGHIFTLLVVMIGWALFYFEDVGAGAHFLMMLIGMNTTGVSGFTLRWFLSERNVLVLIFSLLACTTFSDRLGVSMRKHRICDFVYLGLLGFCILIVMSSSFQSFLYFKY
ncbi:MAG: hypothetical protein K6E30_10775 [Lachnospiraceae bacterium]|nr:hypothetical protein [Lachnospiraceae bacterium]